MLEAAKNMGAESLADQKRHTIGCHRTIPPTETVARIRPIMADMGITRVADVTGLDRIGVPVVMVSRPNARSLSVSQGKGLDLIAATASGLMESVELYHAEHIELPLKLGSCRQLSRSHSLINIKRLPQVHPQRFHEDLTMLWVEGIDLFSGASRWVPYETVRADFTIPPPPGSGCFDCSSNGLASGNSLTEAVCHGICEVIERDATALWNQQPRTHRNKAGLALDSVNDASCREVMLKLQEAEFDIAVWETTSDIAVSSFFVAISDCQSPTNHRGIGAGTHVSRNIALLRALTEAVQVRTTYISGARDDLAEEEYGEERLRKIAGQTADMIASCRPHHNFEDSPDYQNATFSDDLDCLLAQLQKVGIDEAVMVNLTRPEFDVPVVKVVIPGLEAPDDHPGYVPGIRARRLRGVDQ